ncbi:NAD(P)-dependent oxidoreductase [Motiliproteus sp. MSK22-1]|uniref:NAD(P)-dependent oxidoreductase n=1 Tax=Motiliproteus sp. MSK22-1 TaxID=1897630 RepID=UPI0009784A9C|nr:NAD(P)-dependent oxidoreductase [Motiliproteus sp. MSK22-1]OMH32688.1 oxidoreductase [Motiliproteus sp. MSK22-1]
MSQKTVAFIGLGVMGFPMAGHLQKAGYDVCVYNRTQSKAQKWVEMYGGRFETTPAKAAKGASIVFACVGNDHDLRSVTIGLEEVAEATSPADGAFAGMEADAIFVDHTTASAEVARELCEIANSRGLRFLDAPVSGGQAGAENGALTVMVGGQRQAYDEAEPAINVFSRSVRLMGESGAGQLTKMVNQICIAGLVQGLSEGIHFAMRSGLDPKAVVEVISKGAAQSWQMENRYETMVDNKFDYGFAVDWMRKDLGIVLDEARNNGAQLPVTALVDQFYADVQGLGGGRWDTSSLLKRFEHKEG